MRKFAVRMTIACQAFFAQQIEQLIAARPSASYAVPDSGECDRAAEHFRNHEGIWPIQFDWQGERNWPGIEYEIEEPKGGTLRVTLDYRRDDDAYNQSRYTVRVGKIEDARHFAAYGPAVALAGLGFGLLLAFSVMVVAAICGVSMEEASATLKGIGRYAW